MQGKPYLLAYNATLTTLWLWVGASALGAFGSSASSVEFWNAVKLPIFVAQTMSVLEILHVMLGLVKSPLGVTATQVLSRLHVVWIVWNVEANARFCFITLLAWTIAELIRYPFYFLSQLDRVPKFLVTLRYSAFLVLYPMGISGEVFSILKALPVMKSDWTGYPIALPNRLNFQFDLYWCYLLILAFYLPGSPVMYKHMLLQRRKKLGAPVNKSV
eukprot:Trichotokara_eunicae@DN7565_c0_g1_i1.p1